MVNSKFLDRIQIFLYLGIYLLFSSLLDFSQLTFLQLIFASDICQDKKETTKVEINVLALKYI